MNDIIVFNELVLRNFKSHKELTVVFSLITRILGLNGAGKSSIGEAITWIPYGVDTLGNTLQKTLSPEPTNYEFDRVEGHLLLTVNKVQIRISRMIENGNILYFINDIPKKATEFKAVVDSLFDKNLFLSLFNPLYFFSQKWEEQRSQLLKYVSVPTDKEVLSKLVEIHSKKLGALLKKETISNLDAQHRDNKNRQEKQILILSGQVKQIRDDNKQSAPYSQEEADLLAAELESIALKLSAAEAKQKESASAQQNYNKLNGEIDRLRVQADEIKKQHARVKDTPVAEICEVCSQPLNDEKKETVKKHIEGEVAGLKTRHSEIAAKYRELNAQLAEIDFPEFDPEEVQALQNRRSDIQNQINKLKDRAGLAEKLANAEKQEQEAKNSHNESVLILEAIKAFKAAEAEQMAEKVKSLFETLTIELKQYNADGTDKPFFEVYQDGKPFRKLSKAESVKAGMELVDVLIKQSGIVAPMFIDNAESILRYKAPAGQLIECRVADQPLTITEV